MAEGDESHGPRCPACGRFFTPDPRQGDRQKLCGRKACRQEYKNEWQREEYARNPRFRGTVMRRVRRWRWNRPGYWRGGDGASGSDPPVAALLEQVCGTVLRLEAAVNGLASETSGCCDNDDLREVVARCVERGREVLGRGPP